MMTEADERAFQEALKLRDAGDSAGALELLLPLREQLGGSAAYQAVLGHMFWREGRFRDAAAAFRASLAIVPAYEKASLGLFHCLWDTGDTDAAFDEMRRFLGVAESAEYKRLLADINSAE